MHTLTRVAVLAVLALSLAAAPARASDASDAYKRAKELAKQVDRAEAETDRIAAEGELNLFAMKKSAELSGQKLGKMDTAYVGLIQGLGGMKAQAVATLKRAIDHPGKTKYLSTIYSFYVAALLENGQHDEALAGLREMNTQFPGDKRTKSAAMKVGMGLRRARLWKGAGEALRLALTMRNPAALKPLVHSYLMTGDKATAIQSIEWAISTAGEAGADPRHQVLLEITKKIGEPITLEFDAFTPGEAPDLEGKVVVMGFWNVSAISLRWTMELLQSVWDQFPPAEGVVTLGVSTYYKKNPDTGMMEDDMSAETERNYGLSYAVQYGFKGQLAYTKDEPALKALGLTGLPYVVVVGRDGKLRYAHTINRADPTEVEVLREIIASLKQ